MSQKARIMAVTVTDLPDVHRIVLQAMRAAVRLGNGHEVPPDSRPAGPAADVPFESLAARICRSGWRPPGIDPPTAPTVSIDEHLLLRAFGHAQAGKVDAAGALLASWLEPHDALGAARDAAAALEPLAGIGFRLANAD